MLLPILLLPIFLLWIAQVAAHSPANARAPKDTTTTGGDSGIQFSSTPPATSVESGVESGSIATATASSDSLSTPLPISTSRVVTIADPNNGSPTVVTLSPISNGPTSASSATYVTASSGPSEPLPSSTSTSASFPSSSASAHSNRLSGDAKIGLIVGVVVGSTLLLLGSYLCLKRVKGKRKRSKIIAKDQQAPSGKTRQPDSFEKPELEARLPRRTAIWNKPELEAPPRFEKDGRAIGRIIGGSTILELGQEQIVEAPILSGAVQQRLATTSSQAGRENAQSVGSLNKKPSQRSGGSESGLNFCEPNCHRPSVPWRTVTATDSPTDEGSFL